MYIINNKKKEVIEMRLETFMDGMERRGYEIAPPSQTGNVTATKGATTVRWLRTDHEKIYVETSGIKMLISPKVSDAETFRLLDYLVQP